MSSSAHALRYSLRELPSRIRLLFPHHSTSLSFRFYCRSDLGSMRTADVYDPGSVLSASPTSRRYQLEGSGLGAYSACRLLERLFDWQVPRVPVTGWRSATLAFLCDSAP